MAVNMKQYLISFQATLSGHKMVMSSLSRMDRSVRKVTDTTKKAGKQQQDFSNQLKMAAKRALIVAPVWMAIRTAMMLVLRTFSEMIRAFVELDDQLARIRTVMHGTAESINAEMIAIKRQIIDTSLKSRLSIKELAEGFYFLKTANLSATEAMAAFQPTVNLAIGTMNSMAESARAVAGIYNTMGIYLGETLDVHEKFQKIADVLAYTYSTQDVQLSELIQSYTKLAPYVTGLSDNFTELVTMLGFLNTRLLRGGRTGRLTGRAILQLTKNAEKLARIFGITFDPDKPVAFLDTIKQIRDAMGKTGKVTAEQSQILQEVFATRGGVAVRLLIEHFDDLSEQIKDAVANADGFAKKMQELRMNTIAGQMVRMKNVLAVLMDDFLSTAYGAEKLADVVKLLNASLEASRPFFRSYGQGIAYVGASLRENYYQVRAFIEVLKEMPIGIPLIGGVDLSFFKRVADLSRSYRETDIKRIKKTQEEREKYLKTEEEIQDLTKQQLELTEKHFNALKAGRIEEAKKIQKSIDLIKEKIEDLQPSEIKLQKLLNKEREHANKLKKAELGILDKIEQKEKHQIKLMKILGASSLDIAKAQLEILENQTTITDEREHELDIIKARYKVTEEEYKYREQMVNVLQKVELDMLKAAGASELQILEVKERQLEADRKIGGESQYLLELGKLRTQQAIALQKEKQKEVETARSIALAYGKADEFERTRIRRIAELVQLSAEDLAHRYRVDAFDRGVIDDYIGYLSEKQKQSVAEMAHNIHRLPGEVKDLKLELLPKQEIFEYWERWALLGNQKVDQVNARFRAGMPTFGRAPLGTAMGVGAEMPIPSPVVPPSAPKTIYTQKIGDNFISSDDFNDFTMKVVDAMKEISEKDHEKLEELIAAQNKTTRVTEEAF